MSQIAILPTTIDTDTFPFTELCQGRTHAAVGVATQLLDQCGIGYTDEDGLVMDSLQIEPAQNVMICLDDAVELGLGKTHVLRDVLSKIDNAEYLLSPAGACVPFACLAADHLEQEVVARIATKPIPNQGKPEYIELTVDASGASVRLRTHDEQLNGAVNWLLPILLEDEED